MSDNSTLTELGQEVIALYLPSLFAYYVQLAASTLLFYDYFLTFELETSLIWNGKANITKVLFFLNRYAGFIFQCSYVVLYFLKPATDTEYVCALGYINTILGALSDTASYSIFTLRTFAIYEKSWSVFFVLAIPALVDFAAAMWGTAVQSASALPLQFQVGANTCNFSVSSSLFARNVFIIAAFFHSIAGNLTSTVSVAVFDALVVILTVYRTYRLAKSSREANIQGSLSYILLRDGIVYYIAIFLPILVACAFNVVLLKDGDINLSYVANNFNAIFLAFRNVAVNRLVLSLSHAANPRDDSEYRTRTGLEPFTCAANSALGNIGGLVQSGLHDFIKDDEPEAAGNGHGVDIIDRTGFQGHGNSSSADDFCGFIPSYVDHA